MRRLGWALLAFGMASWAASCKEDTDSKTPEAEAGSSGGSGAGGAGGGGGAGQAGDSGGAGKGGSAGAAGGAGATQDGGMDPETSLFDLHPSDAPYQDSGKTAWGCYSCIVDKCHDEVQGCELIDICRDQLACVTEKCLGEVDEPAALACALNTCKASLFDPNTPEGAAFAQVLSCTRSQCAPACP